MGVFSRNIALHCVSSSDFRYWCAFLLVTVSQVILSFRNQYVLHLSHGNICMQCVAVVARTSLIDTVTRVHCLRNGEARVKSSAFVSMSHAVTTLDQQNGSLPTSHGLQDSCKMHLCSRFFFFKSYFSFCTYLLLWYQI